MCRFGAVPGCDDRGCDSYRGDREWGTERAGRVRRIGTVSVLNGLVTVRVQDSSVNR
jgi:hypothetical protein